MKILSKIKYITSAVLVLALMMTGCEDYLDINEDPNNPTQVTSALLLTAAQTNMGYSFGNDAGGLNGHASTVVHQYVQRGTINDYGLQGTDFPIQTAWRSLYAGALKDLNVIIEQSTASEDMQYVGVAQILTAYIYASMVDLWGDIPYSEALQGPAVQIFPAFEDGEDIYASLFDMIDTGIGNLSGGGAAIGAEDLIYGGNVTRWRRLGRTLQFKMLNNMNRMGGGNPTELQALIDGGDLFQDMSDDFEFAYGTSIAPENRNPGFVQEWSTGGQFYYIDPNFFEVMRNQDTFGHGTLLLGAPDPRIPYYFFNQMAQDSIAVYGDSYAENPCAYCPSTTGTGFLSIFSYSFNIDPNEGFDQGASQTIAGLYPLGGAYDNLAGGIASNAVSLNAGEVTGPGTVAQRYLTYDELLYMQAELLELGLITVGGNTARDMLSAAIDASFAKVNAVAGGVGAPTIDAASITVYRDAVLATYDAAADPMEVIMTSKWTSTFGNGMVSYNDARRTGYPVFHDGNADNLATTVQTRQFPVSFPYDINDATLYKDPPQQRNIATDKVFWDN